MQLFRPGDNYAYEQLNIRAQVCSGTLNDTQQAHNKQKLEAYVKSAHLGQQPQRQQ